jgi:hypothetical protein
LGLQSCLFKAVRSARLYGDINLPSAGSTLGVRRTVVFFGFRLSSGFGALSAGLARSVSALGAICVNADVKDSDAAIANAPAVSTHFIFIGFSQRVDNSHSGAVKS